jgi:hypothetical protein
MLFVKVMDARTKSGHDEPYAASVL